MLDVLEHRRRPSSVQDAIRTLQKTEQEDDVRLAEKLGVQLIHCDFGGPALAMLSCPKGHIWPVYRKRNGSWPYGWLFCRHCPPREAFS